MEQLDTLGSQISFATDGSQYLTFQLGEEEYGVVDLWAKFSMAVGEKLVMLLEIERVLGGGGVVAPGTLN